MRIKNEREEGITSAGAATFDLQRIVDGLDRWARMEKERDIAVSALRKIAGADFRGNRPPEQVVAYDALQAIEKLGK